MIQNNKEDIMTENLLKTTTCGCSGEDIQKIRKIYSSRHKKRTCCKAILAEVRQRIIFLGHEITFDIDLLSKKNGCSHEEIMKHLSNLQQLIKILTFSISLEKERVNIEKNLTFMINLQEILCTLVSYFSEECCQLSTGAKKIIWLRKDRRKLMKMVMRSRYDLYQLQSDWRPVRTRSEK